MPLKQAYNEFKNDSILKSIQSYMLSSNSKFKYMWVDELCKSDDDIWSDVNLHEKLKSLIYNGNFTPTTIARQYNKLLKPYNKKVDNAIIRQFMIDRAIPFKKNPDKQIEGAKQQAKLSGEARKIRGIGEGAHKLQEKARRVLAQEGYIIPPGKIIHHRDGNHNNNAIENLTLMSPEDHAKYTAELKRWNDQKNQTKWDENANIIPSNYKSNLVPLGEKGYDEKEQSERYAMKAPEHRATRDEHKYSNMLEELRNRLVSTDKLNNDFETFT